MPGDEIRLSEHVNVIGVGHLPILSGASARVEAHFFAIRRVSIVGN